MQESRINEYLLLCPGIFFISKFMLQRSKTYTILFLYNLVFSIPVSYGLLLKKVVDV